MLHSHILLRPSLKTFVQQFCNRSIAFSACAACSSRRASGPYLARNRSRTKKAGQAIACPTLLSIQPNLDGCADLAGVFIFVVAVDFVFPIVMMAIAVERFAVMAHQRFEEIRRPVAITTLFVVIAAAAIVRVAVVIVVEIRTMAAAAMMAPMSIPISAAIIVVVILIVVVAVTRLVVAFFKAGEVIVGLGTRLGGDRGLYDRILGGLRRDCRWQPDRGPRQDNP